MQCQHTRLSGKMASERNVLMTMQVARVKSDALSRAQARKDLLVVKVALKVACDPHPRFSM